MISVARAEEMDLTEAKEAGATEMTNREEKVTVAATIDAATQEAKIFQETGEAIGTVGVLATIAREEEETPVAATEEGSKVETGVPQTEEKDLTEEETLSEEEALTRKRVPIEARKEGPHTKAMKEEVLITVKIEIGILIKVEIDMTREETDIEDTQEEEKVTDPVTETEEAEKKENHKPKMDAIDAEETTEPRNAQCTGQDQRVNVNFALTNIQAGIVNPAKNK